MNDNMLHKMTTTMLDRLAEQLHALNLRTLSLHVTRRESKLGIAFDSEAESTLMHRLLGGVWTSATVTPITTEGNYLCVLRNNHLVHVQALMSEGQLLLMAGGYDQPLSLLTEDAAFPPVDKRLWYGFDEEQQTLVPWPQVQDMTEVPDTAVAVLLIAGPHVNCVMPTVLRPRHVPRGVPWQALAATLVNDLARSYSQIAWYQAIQLPPHYVKAMFT